MEILLIWGLCGFIGIAIAQKKGINPAVGFLAGAILGPLVFLMLFVKGSGVAAGDAKKCPACAEMVKAEAKICRYCKSPLTVAVLLMLFSASIFAQKAQLTEDEISAAIAKGLKSKGKQQGLVLRDKGQDALAGLTANSYGQSSVSHGFSLVIYSPTTWIQQMASDAAKKYLTLKREDLTEKDLAPVLRVLANPDTPRKVSSGGMAGTSSVEHVVLRDESKTNVIQPTYKEEFTTEASNYLGGNAVFVGLKAVFMLDDLAQLRGPKRDKEFFVTVVGEGKEEKNFKIKKKHFDDLP